MYAIIQSPINIFFGVGNTPEAALEDAKNYLDKQEEYEIDKNVLNYHQNKGTATTSLFYAVVSDKLAELINADGGDVESVYEDGIFCTPGELEEEEK